MNIQDYISSGIVEAYVLGLADSAERVEFERMCDQYDEVRAAREAFEIKLEEQAFVDAIQPPQHAKNRIFAELQIEDKSSLGKEAATVRQMDVGNNLSTSGRVAGWMRYLVAACIILLVGSTAMNFYLFRQYKDYSARYADLLASNSQIVSNTNVLEARLKSYESDLAIIKNPGIAVIPMPGTNVKTSPDTSSLATVYWDRKTNEVYLLVNNLPEPTTDKQYQLWALVDGKPVDAGVFDTRTSTALVRMKNITRAQAFAVTLEKRGGSVAPTMEQLYVLGNVKT